MQATGLPPPAPATGASARPQRRSANPRATPVTYEEAEDEDDDHEGGGAGDSEADDSSSDFEPDAKEQEEAEAEAEEDDAMSGAFCCALLCATVVRCCCPLLWPAAAARCCCPLLRPAAAACVCACWGCTASGPPQLKATRMQQLWCSCCVPHPAPLYNRWPHIACLTPLLTSPSPPSLCVAVDEEVEEEQEVEVAAAGAAAADEVVVISSDDDFQDAPPGEGCVAARQCSGRHCGNLAAWQDMGSCWAMLREPGCPWCNPCQLHTASRLQQPGLAGHE